jgi:hypothetical protein
MAWTALTVLQIMKYSTIVTAGGRSSTTLYSGREIELDSPLSTKGAEYKKSNALDELAVLQIMNLSR